MRKLQALKRAWQGMRAFTSLPPEQRSIVFYSENSGSWPHLGPIVNSLATDHNLPVTYLTSSLSDWILVDPPRGVSPYFIGDGHLRTWLFKSLEARILVMTMPDLDSFHIKRSVYPVHYVYTHHSIVSTHMIYREGAFDHFDTVFCVGPHHEREIRATEKQYNLSEKTLLQHGYPRLDTIIREATCEPTSPDDAMDRILVAPSWGPHGLLETCGEAFVGHLLETSFHVTVRPHPMSRNLNGPTLDRLRTAFAKHPNFSYEEDVTSTESLRKSDLMVSDWSGAALEYAFGRERPVLFVDVPRKVNNPHWQDIEIEPIEASIRSDIGAVLPLEHLADAPAYVRNLLDRRNEYRTRIRAMRETYVFNIGKSAKTAADYLVSIAKTNE